MKRFRRYIYTLRGKSGDWGMNRFGYWCFTAVAAFCVISLLWIAVLGTYMTIVPRAERHAQYNDVEFAVITRYGWLVAIPVYLLLFGVPIVWIIAWRKRQILPENPCSNCTYDLTANTTGTCPECGTNITTDSAEPTPHPVK